MTNTSLPGFTADRALYRSAASYRAASTSPSGDAAAVVPAQQFGVEFCPPIRSQCSACIPIGPAAFGRGRRFCQRFSCRPTIGGGCRCSVLSKGFESCYVPYPDVATL